jgi:DNA-binding NarL/FixJ family response regulator
MKPLTAKQIQVLQEFASGHTVKEAAYNLKLSPKTVECQQRALYRKTGVRGLVNLARYAFRNGVAKP